MHRVEISLHKNDEMKGSNQQVRELSFSCVYAHALSTAHTSQSLQVPAHWLMKKAKRRSKTFLKNEGGLDGSFWRPYINKVSPLLFTLETREVRLRLDKFALPTQLVYTLIQDVPNGASQLWSAWIRV